MIDETKMNLIICPHCGQQYLPAEIYMPNEFLGKPKNIDKDEITGKILDFYGDDMILDETYTCDNCNTLFKVSAKVSFKTTPAKFGNIEEEYTTKLNKQKLFLSEE